MKWKITAIISSACLLVTLLVLVLYLFLGSALRLRVLDSPAVLTQVKKLNQLVTVRYSIQRVVGLTEPKQPLGEESILLMVQGEALAGVDLGSLTSSDIQYSDRNSLAVSLPPPKLFNISLDEKQTKVWDHRVTWWTPWLAYDANFEHRARLKAIDDIRDAALKMGILDQAEKNAETAIRDLLNAFGVSVTFKPASA